MALDIGGGLALADWYLYSVLATFITVLLGAGYWFYHARVKIGYKAVFTRLMHGVEVKDSKTGEIKVIGGVRKIIGKKEINLTQKEVKFKKGFGGKGEPFKLDFTKPAYQHFGWTEFYFDYDTGDVLTFGGIYESLSPADADEFANDGLIRKMLLFVGKGIPLSALVVLAIVVGVAVLTFVLGLLSAEYLIPSPYNGTVVTP